MNSPRLENRNDVNSKVKGFVIIKATSCRRSITIDWYHEKGFIEHM